MAEIGTSPTSPGSTSATTPVVHSGGEPPGFDSPKTTAAPDPKAEAPKTTAEKPAADTFDPKKVLERYKNDPNELAKAKHEQDKLLTKLQQENAALKKSSAPLKEDPAVEAGAKEVAKNLEEAQTEQPANPWGLIDQAYAESFTSGKISEATINQFKESGLRESDAKVLAEALDIVVQTRMKEAQKHVEMPVKEMLAWSQVPGNLTNQELAVYQAALELGNYSILRDLERKIKATGKTTVEHGVVSSGSNADVFNSPDEYYAAKRDPRYNFDRDYTAMVNDKVRRSNKDNWTDMMLHRKK